MAPRGGRLWGRGEFQRKWHWSVTRRGIKALYRFTYLYARVYTLENPGQLLEGWAHQPCSGSLTLRVLFCGNDCYFFSYRRSAHANRCRRNVASRSLHFDTLSINAEYNTTTYIYIKNSVTIIFHPSPILYHIYIYFDIILTHSNLGSKSFLKFLFISITSLPLARDNKIGLLPTTIPINYSIY